jgi:hypothetical protein
MTATPSGRAAAIMRRARLQKEAMPQLNPHLTLTLKKIGSRNFGFAREFSDQYARAGHGVSFHEVSFESSTRTRAS